MARPADDRTVTEIWEKVLKKIQEDDPVDYDKLIKDPAELEILKQAVKDTTFECCCLEEDLKDKSKDIETCLSKYLPDDRIQSIKGGLSIPTIQIDISETHGASVEGRGDREKTYSATTSVSGQSVETRDLSSDSNIATTKFQQYASIVVEVITMAWSTVGIVGAIKPNMKGIIDWVAGNIESTVSLRLPIDQFIISWNKASGHFDKAKVIFDLLKKLYNAGDFIWKVIQKLCEEMTWYDWLKIAVKIIAMLLFSFSTGGFVLIAEIAMVVLSIMELGEMMYTFITKIQNVDKLDSIKPPTPSRSRCCALL
ncbi:uncharacterized protein [Amphiura filiformis]|uniref:uncharacterized protein n=1 Tax=Amphiura filiformis TaxID=82378 RepID=UPI003B2221EA